MAAHRRSKEMAMEYMKYRGRCKELAEKACHEDPELTLYRGWYHCPFWGKQAHWWTERSDGTVLDPSKNQFPSRGAGYYEKYTDFIECEHCGKTITENKVYPVDQHVYCSYECYGKDVM